jgi:Lrp/AsnC family transcriptional regulator, leucine-responsive regulatory protein
MDLIDEQILKQLQKNSRLSMTELGKRVHLSSPAVKERVRQLEESGVLHAYTIHLNYKQLGYPISAIIEAVIKNNRYEQFKQHIQNQTNIEFCYRIAGDACFILKAHFQDFQAAENFIDTLLPLAATKTNFIFSEVVID